jgi:bifunctional DNA-binding transcriptional regulator/antitoxin component of YhaV-PrlF toxin-antitoxin module
MNEVYKAKLNEEGRLVIPAAYRKLCGLGTGQEVMLRATQDGLLITTFDKALQRFQDDVAALVGPNVSLADELIADRRKEAATAGGQ